jgi:hypothetical protein
MSVSTGPQLVTSGLILNLDSYNRKSNILGAPNSLINVNSWVVGNTAVTGYALNQTVANENSRIIDTDPWGNQSIVWGSYPTADSNNDGGWEGSYVAADITKTYRFSVWVRRTSATTSGTFYFGLHTNGTGDTFHLSDGASATNPYWDYRGLGSLTQNTWYLVVGHIFPTGYPGTTAHPNSGIYTIAGGTTKVASNAGNVPNDVKFPSNATSFYNRTYHFYSTDSTSRLQFSSPRIDLVDGNEPSISELLSNGFTSFKDLSSSQNHHSITNNPPYTNNKFTLDNSTAQGFTRNAALNGATSTCTVVMWYATTDAQELWVQGQTTSHYLSASASNNYYHGLCGSPTNFVDMNTVIRPDTPVNYRNGNYHMWEAKNVDFTGWTQFNWWLYGGWYMAGSSSVILVYNRALSANESAQNFAALRGRFDI